MRIPATPEEAKKLEQKVALNDKAGDWVTPIFPDAGLRDPNQAKVDALLKDIGKVRLPPKRTP